MMKWIVSLCLLVLLSYQSEGQTNRLPLNDTCKVFLPSAFTPNADGLNDRLNVLSACTYDEAVLEVYNRWGDMVYRSDSNNEGWDGYSKGEAVPGGMYIWVVKYIRDQEENIVKGTVALLR